MPRNSSKSTNGIAPSDTPKPPRTRTKMYSLLVVKAEATPTDHVFLALVNGQCIARFDYSELDASLTEVPDNFGALDGATKFFRTARNQFSPILVSKSIDEDVILAQAGNDTLKSFVMNYIDRKAARTAFEQAKAEHAETEQEATL